MSNDNRFFEDLAKLTGSAMDVALGSMSEMKIQFDQMVQMRMNEMLSDRDLVTREEFEVVKEMVSKARIEQQQMAKKITELENKLVNKK